MDKKLREKIVSARKKLEDVNEIICEVADELDADFTADYIGEADGKAKKTREVISLLDLTADEFGYALNNLNECETLMED